MSRLLLAAVAVALLYLPSASQAAVRVKVIHHPRPAVVVVHAAR